MKVLQTLATLGCALLWIGVTTGCGKSSQPQSPPPAVSTPPAVDASAVNDVLSAGAPTVDGNMLSFEITAKQAIAPGSLLFDMITADGTALIQGKPLDVGAQGVSPGESVTVRTVAEGPMKGGKIVIRPAP